MEQNKVSQKWAITLFTIAVFMAGLDNGIISTALTTINDSFDVSPSWGTWSITIYTLGMAISVPIIGKLSDRYGRKRLFIMEILLFGIGSLAVALSPNFTFLLISRFIQAVGGGGIFIIGTSHILSTLPKKSQGKALGLLGGMHGLSALIGPNLGAVILGLTGTWQWMFLINLPIALFLIIFGFLKIKDSKPGKKRPLDLSGTFLLSTAILSFMYGITRLDSTSIMDSFLDIGTLAFLITGSGLFIVLILYERHVEKRNGDPIIAFSLLNQRNYQVTLLLGLLSGGFLAGIIFIPAFVQQVLFVPVENAGFWLTPLAVASGVGAGLGGVFADKYGAIKTIIISGFIGLFGFFLFSFFVEELVLFLIASIFAGTGLGMLLGAPLNILAGESALEQEKGSALGTLSLVRQIGLTVFPTLFAGFMTGSISKASSFVQNKYSEALIVSGTNYGDVMKSINQIEEPTIKSEIIHDVSEIIQTGYSQMFITAMVLSALVIICGFYLYTKAK
ncbi:MFS transporter [Oceanobacillus rekensis]|uniref:MFS transporter n=1 Tax=Oceanobacillus rekensis TaxID=937927 RepID=UPI000B4347E0|nr:MFS transporter [Oceanobacillus rekensis]